MRRSVRGSMSLLAVAIVAVMATFVAVRVVESSRSLDPGLVREHAPEVAIVIATSMLSVLALGIGWAALLRGLRPGVPIPRLRLLAIFCCTWPGRYVPGTLPFLAARVYLASRSGYGKRAPTIATGFQSALEVLVSGAFGLTALVYAREGIVSPLAWAFAASVLALTAMALSPRAIARVSTFAGRVLRRDPALDGVALPSRRAMLGSVAGVLACNVLITVAVTATAIAFTDIVPRHVASIAAAVSLSGVAGVLVVLAPAGLGIRDGALAALLVTVMPLETAASVAVAYRALTVVADLLLASLAIGGDRLFAWRPAALPARQDATSLEQRA